MKQRRNVERGYRWCLTAGFLALAPVAFAEGEDCPAPETQKQTEAAAPVTQEPAIAQQQAQDPAMAEPPPAEEPTVSVEEPQPQGMAVAPADPVEQPETEKKTRAEKTGWRNASIQVGGGVEGLGLTLDNRLTTGPMWTASVGVHPLTWMGLEAGYSGSVHEVDSDYFPVGENGATVGSDFVRNGGHLAAIVSVPIPFFQPYVLAGVGFDDYNFRGTENAGLRDDMAGRVPLGAGLRGASGRFTGDVRFNYNVLFDQEFARLGPEDQIGATWDLGLKLGTQF